MQKNVKISVIMGVFNPYEQESLYEAVNSIIHQTFEEWEMILYDDGSEEEYAGMIQEAASCDERIIYIRNEKNHGLAYALNCCIEAAAGEFIARMDADDISRPDRLQKLYDFLKTHSEYQWVGSNSELFDENGIWGEEKVREIPQREDFLRYSPYIHPAVLFRREILIEMNGYKVSELTRRCEDYELFMRLHQNGYRGYNLQENLLLYREGVKAYQKRKYRNRIREMWVRYQGFKNLDILNIKTIPYVIKPLATGLIPPRFLQYIKKSAEKRRNYEYTRQNSSEEVQPISEKSSAHV